MSDDFDSGLELERLYERGGAAYKAALRDMLVAVAMGDKPALMQAREALEDVIGATMGEAEAVGALHTLQAAARVYEEEKAQAPAEPVDDDQHLRRLAIVFARPTTATSVPRVQFMERLRDLITRVPVTVKRAAERTASKIAELYAKGRVIAFVRSAEQAVTERVQRLFVEAVKEGLVEREVGTLVKMGVQEVAKRTADWSEAYARMAYRTNLNTATAAGRFRQLEDPAVAAVITALRFNAVGDADTRDNHAAADGIVMRPDNPEWNRIAPPLGYNCRCTVAFVSPFTLRRMGRVNADGTIREDRVPAGAHPDPGFRHGGRPDLFIKGAV